MTLKTFEERWGRVSQLFHWLIVVLIVLALVHAAAAIYHHLFQHDATLARMLPRNWLRIPDHPQETSDV